MSRISTCSLMNAPWVLDVASNTNRENVDGLRIGNVKRGGAIMITINSSITKVRVIQDTFYNKQNEQNWALL